ncbi:hypothetical protein Gorai_006071 [Gossypium raimondii]|uniref:RNase H type-1 domain-containing protein n=1 Tax=Gossypium raimondii TaxID=29730 RepID=A0A7J8QF24_GOSRA|nr:hypothetical protein [Gossypium raimondii]
MVWFFLKDEGFNKVLIHTDNLEWVNAFQDRQFADSSSSLLRRINQMLRTMDQWNVRHIPREMNQVAGCIAKMISDKTFAVQVFEDVPEQLEARFCANRINDILAYDGLA